MKLLTMQSSPTSCHFLLDRGKRGAVRLEHEPDHSPPSSAEVKNEWSCCYTPLYVFTVWCLIKQSICLHCIGQLYSHNELALQGPYNNASTYGKRTNVTGTVMSFAGASQPDYMSYDPSWKAAAPGCPQYAMLSSTPALSSLPVAAPSCAFMPSAGETDTHRLIAAYAKQISPYHW
jgi:hypothetical protein